MKGFKNFELAVAALPDAVVASFDPLYHKTIEDLISLVEHELDLYDEDEESDIQTTSERKLVARYLQKLRASKLGATEMKDTQIEAAIDQMVSEEEGVEITRIPIKMLQDGTISKAAFGWVINFPSGIVLLNSNGTWGATAQK